VASAFCHFTDIWSLTYVFSSWSKWTRFWDRRKNSPELTPVNISFFFARIINLRYLGIIRKGVKRHVWKDRHIMWKNFIQIFSSRSLSVNSIKIYSKHRKRNINCKKKSNYYMYAKLAHYSSQIISTTKYNLYYQQNHTGIDKGNPVQI
jgi:hypothetical protein